MNEQSSLPFLVNFILGLVLWFGFCSDFSWENAAANVLFPPVVGLVGLASLFQIRKRLIRQQKSMHVLLCLPSVLGGIPYLLLMIVLLIPPFVLGPMLWIKQQSTAILIQQVESPNGSQLAEVYYLPVGAIIPEVNGGIEVRLKYKSLPFVKRDTFVLRTTNADENTHDFLSWVDNETLYIKETEQELKLDWIEWEVPAFILVYIELGRLLQRWF
jgi:hypothetical protein